MIPVFVCECARVFVQCAHHERLSFVLPFSRVLTATAFHLGPEYIAPVQPTALLVVSVHIELQGFACLISMNQDTGGQ